MTTRDLRFRVSVRGISGLYTNPTGSNLPGGKIGRPKPGADTPLAKGFNLDPFEASIEKQSQVWMIESLRPELRRSSTCLGKMRGISHGEQLHGMARLESSA